MKTIVIVMIAASFTAGTALTAEQATAPVTKATVSPNWIRKPTGADFAHVYPAAAQANQQSGRSLIRCIIDNRGGLKDCSIVAESPPSAGFGHAALKLADRFQATADQSGGTVIIPLSFALIPGPPRRAVLAKEPHFIATPTVEDVIKAFPEAAKGRADKGIVHLHCAFRQCVVVNAEPAHMGFEQAALGLGRKFVLEPVWMFQVGADEIQYDLAIQLIQADDPVWKTRLTGHIAWLDTADPQLALEVFPVGALKAGLTTGSATAACTVSVTGLLKDCSFDDENPPGMGFGPAIAELAQHYVMNPWADAGLPAEGSHLRLPMKLVREPDPNPTSTSKP